MRRVLLVVALASAMAVVGSGAVATEAAPFCNPVNMHPNGLPNGQVGFAYSSTLSLTPANNSLQATASFTGGNPPPGLSLVSGPNINQVTLIGSPTLAGTYTFTIEIGATYTLGTICRMSRTYTVTIAP